MIIGFSICGKFGESYYMPTMIYKDGELKETTIEGKSAHYLATYAIQKLVGKKLVMHNASFDTRMTKNFYKVDLIPYVYVDTALLVHTVMEEGAFGMGGSPFGLKQIAQLVQTEIGLDVEKDANEEQLELKESIKRNGGSTTKDNYEIFKADLDILAKYGAADTDLTLRICTFFLEKLKTEGLEKFFFEDEVMPIYREVTIPMEEIGVKLDLPLIEDTKHKIEKDLAEYAKLVKQELLKDLTVRGWIIEKAVEAYPPTSKGTFAQELIRASGIELPKSEKTGKYTLNKATVLSLPEGNLKQFLLSGDKNLLTQEETVKISLKLWRDDNGGDFFNIQSKDQMARLLSTY
jgi:hypothetical protein